jgi:flavin-dependent dehydrogenase
VTAPVVVVGGGPAGAVAAARLAGSGLDVVVVDAARPRARLGECLPASATPILQRLGAWAAFDADHHRPSPGITSSWGAGRLGGRVSMSDPYGAGWQVDRARFDAMLLDLAAASGAEVRRGATVVGVTAHRDGVDVRCRRHGAEEVLTAGLVVDGTGRARRVAHALGGRAVHGDRLVGFAAVATGGGIDERAGIESFPEGWWYRAPVAPGRCVVICFTDPDLPTARLLRRPGGMAELLAATRHFEDLAHPVGDSLDVRAVAAGTSWLAVPSGPRWFAVGDAASAVDPLSARGMLAAIAGGERVAATVAGRDHAYPAWVTAQRVRSRAEQAVVYRLEQRWKDQPFWARRRRGLRPTPSRGFERATTSSGGGPT